MRDRSENPQRLVDEPVSADWAAIGRRVQALAARALALHLMADARELAVEVRRRREAARSAEAAA